MSLFRWVMQEGSGRESGSVSLNMEVACVSETSEQSYYPE